MLYHQNAILLLTMTMLHVFSQQIMNILMNMRFRVLIFCVIIILPVQYVSAQKGDNRYHLYGVHGPMQLNTYFGPVVALSNVEGIFSADIGATGGVIVNKKFFAGLYGQGLITRPRRIDLAAIGYPNYANGEIKMMYGGFLLGYLHKPSELIHWGISSSGGVGVLYLYAENPVTLNSEKIYLDRVFMVTPKLFAEINMTDWFKVSFSAGYRIIGKMNTTYKNQAGEFIPVFDKSGYNRPEFSISMLFGAFGYHQGMLE